MNTIAPPLFLDSRRRDAAWRAAGCPAPRTTLHNQIVHPRHIEDYPAEAKGEYWYYGANLFRSLYGWDRAAYLIEGNRQNACYRALRLMQRVERGCDD
uniref:Uncharacterized protein n=1 Tax=viral metagenome TaxID=1070528 RepID=A0A6M3JR44_9ZZZZ